MRCNRLENSSGKREGPSEVKWTQSVKSPHKSPHSALWGLSLYARYVTEKYWRRGSGSNRRIKVLQTSPLPLGYRASGGLHVSAMLNCRRSVSQAGLSFGAGDRGRTGDIFLGKEALYH
jgi:hypothetical protein